MEGLIAEEGFDTFYFGCTSHFYPLCHEIVTGLKEKYPHIKRVYVRAEYPYLDGSELAKILEDYEDTYFVKPPASSDKADYIERNIYMIAHSEVCIAYYNPYGKQRAQKIPEGSYTYLRPNSGTSVAYRYAEKKGKRIINVHEKAIAGPKPAAKPVASKPARRKQGTGSIRQLKNSLWKGTFSPIGQNGKRISRSVQAATLAECEEKLAVLIAQMKAEIASQKQEAAVL